MWLGFVPLIVVCSSLTLVPIAPAVGNLGFESGEAVWNPKDDSSTT